MFATFGSKLPRAAIPKLFLLKPKVCDATFSPVMLPLRPS